jgi:molybdenum cofactor cytidylyltransferase
MIAGVVLAAGASSRMGAPKAGLPLPGGDTVLSRCVTTLITAGLPRIVVVAGAHVDAVRAALGTHDGRVRLTEHPRWADGQLSSLLAGLEAVRGPALEAVLVTLVDVPLVSPETVRAVVAAWRRTRAPIVRPARGAEHGHPVIFDRSLFDELAAADPSSGAKSVVRRHEAEILNVDVEDDGAFLDLDTPEDYKRALGWG